MLRRLVFALTAAAVLSTSYVVASQFLAYLIYPKPEKKWMQYFYRASGAAPAPKPSQLFTSDTAGFVFTTAPDTAQFLTSHPAYNEILLGDLTGRTVSAAFDIQGTDFTYYGQGTPSNPCARPANARLYLQTNNNDLGASQYWWSNPVSADLTAGFHDMHAVLTPGQWSDIDGHLGTYDAAHTAAFAAAVADVQMIGLSFGGGCFFANGVGNPSGDATLELLTISAHP